MPSFEQQVRLSTVHTDYSRLGEAQFLKNCIADLIDCVVLLRNRGGKPSGRYVMTVGFEIPEETPEYKEGQVGEPERTDSKDFNGDLEL